MTIPDRRRLAVEHLEGRYLLAGDLLVRGAVNLALRLGIPALMVGMTVVAFGTSAPELLVSVKAVLADAGGDVIHTFGEADGRGRLALFVAQRHRIVRWVGDHDTRGRHVGDHAPARALDADPLQAHRHGELRAAIVEQLRLLGGANQAARECPGLELAVLVELAQLRYRLLNHPPPDAHAAHQAPVPVNLAVLLARSVAQVHATDQNPADRKRKAPRSALHARFSPPRASSH